MKKSTCALTTLLIAGALVGLPACGGDDDENENNGIGSRDGGSPSGGDAGGVDGGTGGDPSGELTACPTHPNVRDMGMVCAITAPVGNEIKTDLTLAPVAGKRGYLLENGVFVGEDVGGGASADAAKKSATLTIKAGTTVYGASPLSFLLVTRGSKIDAQGTRDKPVVFTSAQAAPKPGDWGGLILNGRAPTNKGNEVAGEAMTGMYGGPDAADNSGTLKYVRVEFTGGKVDDMNELNGVAFQGVGNGTTVDYVQVHGSDDDAFEWFGGTVNAKHLVATGTGDDGLDWVSGWNGKIQYAVVQQWPRVSSANPNGIEGDNSSTATAAPISTPTLSNVTLIGGAGVPNAKGAHLRAGTQGKLHSTLVLGFTAGCLQVEGPESSSYVGTLLTTSNSAVSCATNFIPGAGAASQLMFDAPGANNKTLAPDAAVLTAQTNTTTPNFLPVSNSPALTGGATPTDSFFKSETFIGALGTEDWTMGWTKITPFSG